MGWAFRPVGCNCRRRSRTRRSWGSRRRPCWRSCGERDWRSKAGEAGPGLSKSLGANGGMESDRSKVPDEIVDGLVADGGHEGRELGRTEETGNGFGQIAIGGRVTGNEASDFRKNLAEIPTIEIP